MDDFISTEWLAQHLDADDLAIVDCTAFLPTTPRDAKAEFLAAHIPGARFLDIAEVADHSHPAPHMLPDAAAFGAAMKQLGVGRDERIVIYDNSPLRTAARGWFMFRHFGAEKVAVLDGGLGLWLAEGRPVEMGDARPRPGQQFDAKARAGEVVSKADILAGTDLEIVDARSIARFTGEETDPRPNVAAGHIPGARCLPMSALYREDGIFRDAEEIRALFAKAGIDPAQPFIASCGSGVTANSLLLAARRIGGVGGKLYDGSWSEWGADPATPKEIGPAL
ncbi:MAG: 3-mercaptopyruvate sulfurtransferase [Sphingomicrobium sp.]